MEQGFPSVGRTNGEDHGAYRRGRLDLEAAFRPKPFWRASSEVPLSHLPRLTLATVSIGSSQSILLTD